MASAAKLLCMVCVGVCDVCCLSRYATLDATVCISDPATAMFVLACVSGFATSTRLV